MDPRVKQEQDKLNAHLSMAQETKQYNPGLGADIGYAECANSKMGLRDRVAHQLDSAQRAFRRAERLQELAILLSKHPDVARILDLIEEVH